MVRPKDPRHGPIARAAGRKARLPGGKAVAEDLYQVGWVAVLTAGLGPEAPPSHVARTAGQAMTKHLRTRVRTQARAEAHYQAWAEGPSALELEARRQAAALVLARLLGHLTPSQRAVVVRLVRTEASASVTDRKHLQRIAERHIPPGTMSRIRGPRASNRACGRLT